MARCAAHLAHIVMPSFPVGGFLEEEPKVNIEKEWKEKLWACNAALYSERHAMTTRHMNEMSNLHCQLADDKDKSRPVSRTNVFCPLVVSLVESLRATSSLFIYYYNSVKNMPFLGRDAPRSSEAIKF